MERVADWPVTGFLDPNKEMLFSIRDPQRHLPGPHGFDDGVLPLIAGVGGDQQELKV